MKEFNALHDEYYGMLYFWVLSKVKNKENAEDICSQAFEKALKHNGQLDDPEKFKSWLYAIAAREMSRFWRRSKIVKWEPLGEHHEETPDPHDFTEELAKYQERQRLARLVNQLDAIHKQAVERWLAGRSCQGTWGSRLSNAKKELRWLCLTTT